MVLVESLIKVTSSSLRLSLRSDCDMNVEARLKLSLLTLLIIVFNIFGVPRAEIENSARIWGVALICMWFGCRSFHILRGLFRVNDVYYVTSYYCIVVCQLFLTVIKYSVSS